MAIIVVVFVLSFLLQSGHVSMEVTAPASLEYTVREETGEGQDIGDLMEDAGLRKKYPPDIQKILRFRYLSKPILLFTLEMMGKIMTGERIDREQICPMQEFCKIKFDVAVQPVDYFEIIKVTIFIEDINDNWPAFTSPSVTHQVLESTAPGATLAIPSAIDMDSPQYGIQRYEIQDSTGKFGLKYNDKLDGSTDVKIMLQRELDREMHDEYTVKVVAIDGGGLNDFVEVYITVQDANDFNPMFFNKTYEVTIDENIPHETDIVKVKAWDADIGENAEIRYGFSARTRTKYGDLFDINEVTGDIFVIGEIDYEANHIYHLSVTAKDMGPGAQPVDATVVVRVNDLNDNAPDITINTLKDSTSLVAEVLEDSDIGTFVAHVTVMDEDSGPNGLFNCILNDNHFELVKIYDTEYQVVTAIVLDREITDSYDILVECTDKGVDSQTSIKDLHVIVGDRNDHKPVFDKVQYTASLMENNYEGQFIVKVNATDRDHGRNADIHYILPSNVIDRLKIDSATGRITAAKKFDREKEPTMRFKITAVDQGDPSKTGTAVILIHIQDLNDEAPYFEEQSISFVVSENKDIGTEVGRVIATDRDEKSPNTDINYSISRVETELESLRSFQIDEVTGVIRTKLKLDREETPEYYLVVRAVDSGEPQNTGSSTVTIYVRDMNDHDPEITFPNPNNHTVQVSAQAPKDYFITRIQAFDRDIDKNAELSYTITNGNSDGIFRIHHENGIVKTAKALYNVPYERHSLTIEVSDNGDNSRHAHAPLEIYINETLKIGHVNGHGDMGRNRGDTGGIGGVDFFSGNNLLIVISLAAASAIIAVILIIAIIFIHRRSKRDKDEGTYNCRQEEAKKILQNQNRDSDSSNNSLQKTPYQHHQHHHPHPNGGINYGSHMTPKKEVSFSMEKGVVEERYTPNPTAKQPTHRIDAQHSSNHPNTKYGSLARENRSQEQLVEQNGNDVTQDGGVKQWHPSQKDLDSHHLVGTLKKHEDADSSYSGDGSYQDSGKGTSDEGEYTTPTHANNGRKHSSGDQLLSNLHNSTNAASSYNKRKPDFRTFSPVNTILREDSLDGEVHHPLLENNMTHHNTLPNNHMRTLSPATGRRQHTLPVVKTKPNDPKTNNFGPQRGDHTANTYQAGYTVDPDDLNYTINEFMLSNCKEEMV